MDPAREPVSLRRSSHDRAHDVLGEAGGIDAIFHPRTVAVVGPTAKPDGLGYRTLAALTGSHFDGSIVNVTPREQDQVLGIRVYPSLNDLPATPDLAVVVTPDDGVCDAVGQCARAGVKGVVVISGAHLPPGAAASDAERSLREQLRYGRMRMIGPGCCALMNPASGLNISPGLPMPVAGSVAFIAQSGSLAATILDWARKDIVGFSAFVSLGALVDVGWGNLIDYFGSDPNTRSILVHMESVVNIRSFLSAAREVALQKPILVVKGGRSEAAARALGWYASSHVSDDDVLDAAFRRVGVLRVDSMEDLFSVADALSKQPRPRGPRLAVVSNAAGPGVLAADHVVKEVGSLAEPAARTPPDVGARSLSSYRAVPMDVLGDGSSEPFLEAVRSALGDRTNDGVLLLLVPQVMSDPVSAVQSLLALETREKPILLCMTGPGDIPQEEEHLVHACLPVLPTMRAAARVFDYMWRYSHDLRAIYETPELHADVTDRDIRQRVGELMLSARRAGRGALTRAESAELLSAYGIRGVDSSGFPLAPPQAPTLDAVPPAIQARDGYELRMGSRVDPEFGPILWCGVGGRCADLLPARVVGLPPLTATLARRMLEHSLFFGGLRDLATRGELSLTAVEASLVRLSQLVVEQPAIKEVRIDPLLVTAADAFAVDTRILVHRESQDEHVPRRPAFRPFPLQYVSQWTTRRGQTLTIRPIRAEDEPLMIDFHGRLSDRTVYLRYFQRLKLARRTAHEALTRVCFVDYDREIALVAEGQDAASGRRSIVAVASLTKLHRSRDGEVAVLVGDDCQRRGLGMELVRRLVTVARDEHLERVVATTMAQNDGMCAVFRKLGFTLTIDPEDDLVQAVLRL